MAEVVPISCSAKVRTKFCRRYSIFQNKSFKKRLKVRSTGLVDRKIKGKSKGKSGSDTLRHAS